MDKNPHLGSSFDSFLEENGIAEVVHATAVKRAIAFQIAAAMKEQHISKNKMAKSMATSRAQVDRLLDPSNSSVKLDSLERAARVVGRRLVVGLEPVNA
jgi:antitoxin HicB